MPLLQVTYDVPEPIAVGLSTGLYTREGNTIRGSKGFVAHLKEVFPSTANSEALSKGQVAVIIGAGIVVATCAGFGVAWLVKKSKVKKKISKFTESFNVYLEAIKKGKLEASILDNLDSSLGQIRDTAQSGIIKIDVIPEIFDSFKKVLADYTALLAKANSIPYDEEVYNKSSGDNIVDIRRYLYKQREIIDTCA